MSNDDLRQPSAKDHARAIAEPTGETDCPVIVAGIGFSTGGVKSLKQFFAQMPAGHGVAFVLIRCADPSHEDLTAGTLRNQTAFEVVEATDGIPVMADRIYVIPPDKFLNINGCRITLQEPILCNGLLMPIDHFFCSLATDQRSRGCGIVLSGPGSDGTLGLSEIKAAGGRTLVEDPGSAEFPEMPRNAIEAGVVDAILPAETMAKAIIAMAEEVSARTCNAPKESPEFDANLRAVLEILRQKVGHDFRCYKPNTLVRRIRRRMTLGKIPTFADYAQFLQEHPEEVSFLKKDLLIGVTEFFRQPQAWEVLEKRVIAPIVENAPPGSEIRVWVPGCSTGKEAYSLAMLLSDQAESSGKKVAIQIFATDSDSASLATARSGTYSEEEIGENVSPERLKRFFARKDGRFQVVKRIREQIVFAPQNLTTDPPFSKLDLISCRNLLIYLDQSVQEKIIALFHFALREGGFLFLGSAETVGEREDLFGPVSKKWRIYRRMGVGRPVGVEIPARPTAGLQLAPGHLQAPPYAPKSSLASLAQQMLLDRFAPACVMIDRRFQVLYVHGKVEDYLTFPPGELTTRVVDMAREGVRARLRGAIDKCLEINRSVSVTARVRRGEKSVPVKATVSPLKYPRETDGLLLIAFEDYRFSAGTSRRKSTRESDTHQLEDELKITREELQSTIEQLETSNDQLKASNEEVIAANEELQSANEEMETSKEELQSLNEELNTINARLQEKVDELENVNNDLLNLLSSTSIATVFLNKDLKIKRFTPPSTRFFSLIHSDLGRPIADVLRRFRDETLLDDARQVLADLTPIAAEVQADDEQWYIRRITPYRTQDDRIEGVVVTFSDVTELKRSEQRNRYLADLLERSDQPFGVGYPEGAFGFVNAAFERLTGYSRDELKAMDWVRTLTPPEWQKTEQAKLEEIHRTGQPARYEKEYVRKDGTRVPIELLVHLVTDGLGKPLHYYSFLTDLTERKKAEQALRTAHARNVDILESIGDGFFSLDREWRVTYINERGARLLGKPLESLLGRSLWESFPEAAGSRFQEAYQQVMTDRAAVNIEEFYPPLNAWFGARAYPSPEGISVFYQDITDRKRAEQSVRDSEARFKLLSDTASRLLETDNPQEIVNELCRAVMAHLGCHAFFNFLVDEEAGRLHLNAYAGIPEEEARKLEWLDYGTAVCGCVARDGVGIVAENILTTPDPRTDLVKSYGIQAYACNPLMVQGQLIGTLSFGTKSRPHFFLEELALMRTVADQVATAMERMRLIKELQRSRSDLDRRVRERTADLAKANQRLRELSLRILTAQEEERKRIAGDIHDSLGSLLNQIKFGAEGAMETLKGKVGTDVTERLNSLIPVIQEGANECRRLQMDMRPAMLDDLGILATLSWFCRRFETTYPGIRIERKTDALEDDVPDLLKTSIFRITQEALNNIAKHSKADLVVLSLKADEAGIELGIGDNGLGFDVEGILSTERSHRGLGLVSMKERVELSGGAFSVESSPGKGTTLRASWPVEPTSP
jgi:two-component system, chemotaxis family, CheB/CheR fusion protein